MAYAAPSLLRFSCPNDMTPQLLLTHSFEQFYLREVPLLAGVAELAYAADSKGNVAACHFETLRNRLILQKKTTSTRSSRLLGFWVIFETFLKDSLPKLLPKKFCRGMPEGSPINRVIKCSHVPEDFD